MRWRILLWLLCLIMAATVPVSQPWPVIIGAATYLVLVYPSIWRSGRHG